MSIDVYENFGNNIMNVCGIDVSKNTLEIVVRKNGKSQKSRTFKNSLERHIKLIQFLKQRKVEYVCIEATGNYHLDCAIAISQTNQIKVMVINPRAAFNFSKALMQRTKTDAIDAEMLAQYADRMDFVEWEVPSNEALALRTCSRWLSASIKDLTRLKNKLHAFETTKTTPKFIITSIKKRIQQLEKHICEIETKSIKIINKNSDLKCKYKLLNSVSGIADKTAIKLLGEIVILSPDMSAKQWVAHAGLFPQIITSGNSVNKKTRIGKMGNHYIRNALYMAALVAAYHNPNVSAFYQHLVNDNGLKKIQALCAVMRKMLLSIHAMLRNKKPFDGSLFHSIKIV